MLTDMLLENNLVPDALIRQGIRRLLRQRLRDEDQGDPERQQARLQSLVERLKKEPIAVHTRAANEQHYEVPTAFYTHVLGPHLKYSSGYWNAGVTEIERSEEDMLALTVERAQLFDGQDVLELGCGWGSLTLYAARRFPNSRITGVSNSRTQREHILEQAKARGLNNISIVTADINDFEPRTAFDRVVSVEMFEHMRNYDLLMGKVARALRPDGKLFVHIFTHQTFAYLFEVKDESDWMSKYFFTGGIMPSDHLLLYFQKDLTCQKHWRVGGTHYQKTSEAWLARMDSNHDRLMPLFEKTYSPEAALKWWSYWRIFFMSCAELWGFRGGREWFVSHYLFQKASR